MNLPENKYFTAEWGRTFIKHLGGDPSPIQYDWYWNEFYQEYSQDQKLMKKAMAYFKKMKCVEAAYEIARRMPEHREWAEKIIEKSGNAGYAYWMVYDCGSNREWAEKIIEKSGDVHCAYLMVRNCGSSREWAEKIIEKAMDAEYAYWMVRYCGSNREWAEKVENK